jgi:hypothetical protein
VFNVRGGIVIPPCKLQQNSCKSATSNFIDFLRPAGQAFVPDPKLGCRARDRIAIMPQASWPFDQRPNVAAVTTRQVLDQGLPILRVTHYADDDSWAFICGTTDLVEDGRVITMEEAVALDSTLLSIADLPPGFTAWRQNTGSGWNRFRDEDA